MNAKEGLKLVFGSVVVYVVMAACASVGTMSPSDTSAGAGSSSGGAGSSGGAVSGSSSGGSGSDGSGSAGGSTGDDSGVTSFLDALTDPVPAANADTTQSGSRLKAKYYVGSDGSKQFAGWHDSMLNVDCSFLLASDATTRCLPIGGNALVTGFFSDSGCTQPLAGVMSKGCAPATYAYQGVAPAAPTCTSYSYRIFQVGPAYSGGIYSGTPSSCIAAESDAGPSVFRTIYDFYSLGSEVAPSKFVAATTQTDP